MNLRLAELREIVADQVVDVHDLVDLLELTIEDVLARFPGKLREHRAKFGVADEAEEDSEQQAMD